MTQKPEYLIVDEVRSFARGTLLPNAGARDKSESLHKSVYDTLYDLGAVNTALPLSQDGTAWSTWDISRLFTEIGYASAGVCSSFTGILLGSFAISEFATPSVKKHVFGDLKTKKPLFSLAMTEDNAGFDVARITTVAQQTSDGFRISGKKSYVSNASFSEHFAVFARTFSTTGEALGISCFYIARNTPGLEPGRRYKKLGHRESDTAELVLKDVEVPTEALIGELGRGLDVLMRCLGRTKIFLAASSLGVMNRALDLAMTHLSSRRRADKSLLDKPAIQHAMIRLMAERESLLLTIEKAGEEWDKGGLSHPFSNVAKLLAADLCVRTCTEAMEWVGASGYVDDHEISRLYRDAKLFEIYEGSSLVLETQLIHQWMPKIQHESHLKKAA
ncbi:MAG: acyl-CoA dehydrogenase family protein [Bdellovibrionota bacterium]